jgi:hypothetical protein
MVIVPNEYERIRPTPNLNSQSGVPMSSFFV